MGLGLVVGGSKGIVLGVGNTRTTGNLLHEPRAGSSVKMLVLG